MAGSAYCPHCQKRRGTVLDGTLRRCVHCDRKLSVEPAPAALPERDPFGAGVTVSLTGEQARVLTYLVTRVQESPDLIRELGGQNDHLNKVFGANLGRIATRLRRAVAPEGVAS